MNTLKHDIAFLISVEILNIFSGLLREEEQRDALWEIYECVRLGMAEYETKADRNLCWLSPGRN
jgi:hypothetical protein